MQIGKTTILADVPELKPFLPYLMYRVNMVGKPAVELSPAQMQGLQPTWPAESMVRGLQHLAEAHATLIPVYDEGDFLDDPQKADIHLIYLPAPGVHSEKPPVFLVAGGAYSCVCSLVESLPVAAQLNELGYHCFVFNYRCGCDPCLPKPLDDLAAAIALVQARRREFGIATDDYVVLGFSAGANVSALWGTVSEGWAAHGLNRPKALFLMYPFVSFDTPVQAAGGKDFVRQMIGRTATEADVARFDIPKQFTAAYPPCFIAHAQDDDTVPVSNSLLLKRLLDEADIPAKLELIECGGHGWGDGTGTAAEGWPGRASAWLESLG